MEETKGLQEEVKVEEGNKGLEQELKNKHKKIYQVDYENDDIEQEFTFYFTKPTVISLNRALKSLSKKSLQAMKDFTLDNIVEEQKEDYLAAIEEYPAMPMVIGQKLMALLGVSDTVTIKKL